jgi:TatD-related deoxyribonuclease
MLFADGHLHSNPVQGLGAKEIGRRLVGVGAWFVALVALPPYHYGIPYPSREAYEKLVELVASECRALRELGLRVACLVGLHPAEIDRLEGAGLRPEQVLGMIHAAVDAIDKALRAGIVDGIGEIGRQHYRTTPLRYALAEYAMLKLLELAKDYDVPVHLHLESGGEATVHTVAELIRLTSVKRERVLLHHSTATMAKAAQKYGFTTTILARYEALKAALHEAGPTFIPESDFLDDPRRPCVAQCPWAIPSELRRLLEDGVASEDDVYRVNVDNVARFYGVEPP